MMDVTQEVRFRRGINFTYIITSTSFTSPLVDIMPSLISTLFCAWCGVVVPQSTRHQQVYSFIYLYISSTQKRNRCLSFTNRLNQTNSLTWQNPWTKQNREQHYCHSRTAALWVICYYAFLLIIAKNSETGIKQWQRYVAWTKCDLFPISLTEIIS